MSNFFSILIVVLIVLNSIRILYNAFKKRFKGGKDIEKSNEKENQDKNEN